jgi:hypothetical protein
LTTETTIKKEKKKIAARILKATGWLFGIILLLLLLVIFFIQVPGIQQIAKIKVVSYLEEKFGTPVEVGRLSISFPKMLELEDVFIGDSNKDTLLYGESLRVNLQMFALLQGNIKIDEIALRDIKMQLKRDSAGNFNFDHILNAFGGNKKPTRTQNVEDTLAIELNKVIMDRVKFLYTDATSGIDGKFSIGQLRTGFDKFDIARLNFEFKDFNWQVGSADIKMWRVPKSKDSLDTGTKEVAKNGLPVLYFDKAYISEIDFNYVNKDDGMDMQAFIGSFQTKGLNLRLNENLIDLGKSNLSQTSFSYQASSPLVVNTTGIKAPNWIIISKDISIKESRFNYDDQSQPKLSSKGMDYAHLSFTNINLNGDSLYVSGGDTVKANIIKGAVVEKSGLVVKELTANLMYTTKGVSLRNLNLVTPNSHLKDFIEVGYESPSYVADNPGELWMSANLIKSVIGHRDLLTVAPLLYAYPMFADFPTANMQINGKVSGLLRDLTLEDVTFKGFGSTTVRASGRIIGLPDPNKLITKLDIKEFSTTDKDILNFIPAGLIPDYVVLPANASFKGSLSGSASDRLTMNVTMQSSMGGAAIKGYINNADNTEKVTYDLKGSLSALDIGALISNKDLGKVTMNFDVKGSSFDPEKMAGTYQAYINSFEYLGVAYKNIEIKSNADKGLLDAIVSSHERAHQFNLTMNANLRGEFPAIQSNLIIDTLDLQYLKFSKIPLTISAKTDIDFAKLDMDNPVGDFYITDLKGIYDTTNFQFDSLYARASGTADEQFLILKTDFGHADIRGRYSVAKLFPEILQFINNYYQVTAPSPALYGDQQAMIKMTLYPSGTILKMFPELIMTGPLDISLDFDSKICIFDLAGTIPRIDYGIHHISGGSIFGQANDSAIAYKIFIDDYESTVYQIPTLLLEGDVLQHKLYAAVRLLDSLGRLQHTMAAVVEQRDSGYAIHFDPKSVLLNYEEWGLDPANELFVSAYGIFANSFTFSNGTQALVLQTFGEDLNDPLGIRLFNFKISTFTGLARQDSLYLDGTLNGFAEVKLDAEHPFFVADMEINSLMFKQDTIGDISLMVNNEVKDIYKIDAKLTGYENDLKIVGEYNGAEDLMDIQLDIEKMMLKSLQPFAFGYLNNMTGHLEGGISVTGKTEAPVVIGNILFRDAEANVPLLNSVFSLRNERVRFLKDGVHFNEFTLTDANGKTAVINGAMLTKNWIDYRFNIDFEANDFRVINSTRRNNKLFYGTLFLDSKIRFRGDTDRPDITATFKANAKTNLTMVMPQTDPEVAEREGVVEFFDADSPDADSLFAKKVDSLNTATIKGLSLYANLEIDPNATLSFIIDEANGDMLVAKGVANLSASIDPSGKVSVTGIYELIEGSYDMTLRILKFNFKIERGSTITWTGEPTNADINVTALYEVKTAPFSLVEQQISGESAENQARYRDRMPFNVKLNVRGELLKPDIDFDIEIAQTSGTSAEVVSTVNSKLGQLRNDETQMNQQVFALILFGSFVPENPFASSSGGGGNASSIARQSVSKMLSSQLNQLAGSLVSGIDVDIGIESEEDFSTGAGQMRTDLNVALSKSLLKDRLKITVGSNFELEGSTRPNEKTSNIAGDIKADYTLTRDGQYILRAYRIDQYEVALQGQVVETGVTFIISMNFDTFKEIFENKKKKAEIKP